MAPSTSRRAAGVALLAILFMAVPSVPPAAADEIGCNADIARHSARLIKSHEARIKRCLKRATNNPCTPFDQHVDASKSKLEAAITKVGGDCDVAVNGGVPFSQLGPGDSCPVSHARCDETVGAITSLEDLSDCLICMMGGVASDAESRMASSNRFSDPNEGKCIRSLFNVAIKAARKGRNQVERCARGLAQPVSCPVDDDPTGKFGRLLAKIIKKVDRCKDAAGVPGQLALDFTETLCRDGSFPTNTELAECYENTARCVACLYSNRVFGQSQDCSLFSGTGCRGTSWVPGMTYVANQGDDTITFYGTDGLPINGTVAASSFAVGPSPTDVATSSHYNVVYSLNSGDATVTLLDGRTGEPYLGTLANSTVPAGTDPVSLESAGRLSRPALYVLDGTDEAVTLLHPTTGKFLNGDAPSSTFAVGTDPRSVGRNRNGVIVVSNFGDDTVTVFDAVTGDYIDGDLVSSTRAVGDGPTRVSRDEAPSFTYPVYVANSLDATVSILSQATATPSGTLAVPGTPIGVSNGGAVPGLSRNLWALTAAGDLRLFDLDGSLGMGTPANSTFAIAGSPSDLRYSSGSDSVHLLLAGTEELATFPADITNDSGLDVDCPVSVIMDIAVDEVNDRLYVACGNSTIRVFDASGTPAYAFGTEAASTFTYSSLGTPREVEVDGTAGILYVSFIDTGATGLNIAYVDPVTGAHLGSSPYVSLAPSPQFARAPLVLDSARNTLYTVDPQADALLYLNATTGAYLNGTLAASSLPLGDNPIDLAIDRTAGIVYALVHGVTTEYVAYADADSVDYLGVDLAASSIATEPDPTQIAASASAGLAYVANNDFADTVTYFDGASPAYANGTLGASTFAVDGAATVAVDPVAGRLYAGGGSGAWGTTTILDASTGAYINGTLASSQFPMFTPRFLVANSSNATYINASDQPFGTNLQNESIMYFDGSTGAPVDWGPAIATAPTGPSPSALAVMR